MTKTFMPTGGWIRPSSTVMTMMTPNQIGSKPSAVTSGKMIGTVRMINRHGVHQAAQHQVHDHDDGEHAVGADAEAGQELRHLLRHLGDGEEVAEQQRADQHGEDRRRGARGLQQRGADPRCLVETAAQDAQQEGAARPHPTGLGRREDAP